MASTGPQVVTVNGSVVSASAIAAEAQNHPSETPIEAWRSASRALVVRELLLQRARCLGIRPKPIRNDEGQRETEEEAVVRQLLDAEIQTPRADEAACLRYYRNNSKRFQGPTLYEAAHILFAASPSDEPAYREATGRAKRMISSIESKPSKFAGLARKHSDCPSGRSGGNLGQVAKGDTVPEVETYLDALEEGQLCPVPVKSRYGVHVLRLDRRIEGRTLPFETAQPRIARYLEEASWRRAVAQYMSVLAGRASIKGVDLPAASSSLVQ